MKPFCIIRILEYLPRSLAASQESELDARATLSSSSSFLRDFSQTRNKDGSLSKK